MSLGWDPTTAQVVIEAHPITDVDADDNDESLDEDGANEPEMLLVRMPVGTARAFAKRTREIVGAGRPDVPALRLPRRRRRAHLHPSRGLMPRRTW